jgi:hypothetical protein
MKTTQHKQSKTRKTHPSERAAREPRSSDKMSQQQTRRRPTMMDVVQQMARHLITGRP